MNGSCGPSGCGACHTPYGRNVLAHALVRLQRDGWLRDAPEWFDAASRPSGDR